MAQLVFNYFLLLAMLWVLILIFACLIQVIRVRYVTDRIVTNNMITTFVIIFIGILAVYLKQGYLLDVAVIYAMLGFLAVVVLCKIYEIVWTKGEKHD